MNKRFYQKPAIQVLSFEPVAILAGTVDANQEHVNKRGSLYDGIPVRNEPYDGEWD